MTVHGVERILAFAFSAAALVFSWLGIGRVWSGEISESLFFFALSCACAGAALDAINMFGLLLLGRADRLNAEKRMPVAAKLLFVASALLALPKMFLELVQM